jgi:DNA-binding Lrp family transcriptional regulator
MRYTTKVSDVAISDFRDIVSLVMEKSRSFEELQEILGSKYSTTLRRINALMQKGVMRRFVDHVEETNGASYRYQFNRQYKSYTIISGIEGVLCDYPDPKEAIVDTKLYLEHVEPYWHVDNFFKNFFSNAKLITFITTRNKSFFDVTRDWIHRYLGISNFVIIFTTLEKLMEKCKDEYNRANHCRYNIFLHDNNEIIDMMEHLEKPNRVGRKVTEIPGINALYNEMHPFKMYDDILVLKWIYSSFIKPCILQEDDIDMDSSYIEFPI